MVSLVETEVALLLRRERLACLALQETRAYAGSWPLNFHEYFVFERPARKGDTGERGVALAIHKSLAAFPVGVEHPNWILVQVSGARLESRSWILGGVYVPQKQLGPARRSMLCQLSKSLKAAANGDHPIAIMGDWNMSLKAINLWVKKFNGHLSIFQVAGSPSSLHTKTGKGRTAIDLFVVNSSARDLLSRPKVDRNCDLSDHWPVLSRVRSSKSFPNPTPLQPSPPNFNHSRLKLVRREMLLHPGWGELDRVISDPISELHLETLCGMFQETSLRVAKESGILTPPLPKKTVGLASNAIRHALKRRSQAWTQLRLHGSTESWNKWQEEAARVKL
ncbi:hypothetical protein O6H91_16G037500 [Diphasiastrum complanatum]|uniref:Uncharacterized protein n=1 Tax=Diphasiastrum complanatum TaxID=34168 RepID=A0ACC2BBF3_DIPCM|nr:hypothetical protein O6H91_16G037500 [Diphasiastrum complanatum]